MPLSLLHYKYVPASKPSGLLNGLKPPYNDQLLILWLSTLYKVEKYTNMYNIKCEITFHITTCKYYEQNPFDTSMTKLFRNDILLFYTIVAWNRLNM